MRFQMNEIYYKLTDLVHEIKTSWDIPLGTPKSRFQTFFLITLYLIFLTLLIASSANLYNEVNSKSQSDQSAPKEKIDER
jgi:hypothetical protein